MSIAPLHERLDDAAERLLIGVALIDEEALAALLDEAADALAPKDALPAGPFLVLLGAALAVIAFTIVGVCWHG